MSQYITLLGSEDVARAGSTMQSAASDMLRAADTIQQCTTKLEQLFGQGYGSNLDRLIEALEKNAKPQTKCVCGFCNGTECA